MISTVRAGQHVTIKPGVRVGSRCFLPDEEGEIQQEHTHNAGGAIITIVRLADGEDIPFFADELTEEGHTMLDQSRTGERVQTKKALRTADHKFVKGAQGTILYEYPNNLGKILVTVNFDGQGQWNMFLEEIEPVPTGGPL